MLGPLTGRNELGGLAIGIRRGRPVTVSGGGDPTVWVRDLDSGEPVLGPLTGHNESVGAVAIGTRQGRPVIVSGGWDRTVWVWDLDSGKQVLGPLTGHHGQVTTVAVGVRHGRPVIVSVSHDQTIRMHDFDSEHHTSLRIELGQEALSAVFTANGLVIGSKAELVRIDLPQRP